MEWFELSPRMEEALAQWAADRDVMASIKARPMGLEKETAKARQRLYLNMSESEFIAALRAEARISQVPGSGAYLGDEMAMNIERRRHGLPELPLTAGIGRPVRYQDWAHSAIVGVIDERLIED